MVRTAATNSPLSESSLLLEPYVSLRPARDTDHLTIPDTGTTEDKWNSPAARPGDHARPPAQRTHFDDINSTRPAHRWIEA
jgi:hypothetical protein